MQFARDHGSAPQHYYSAILGYFYRQKLEMLCDFLPANKQEKVLEVGYGSGICLKELSGRFHEVHGIDIHDLEPLVKQMLERERVFHVKLHQHDIFSNPVSFQSNFDCVISSSVFEHIQLQLIEKGVRHVYDCLKPGGVFLIGFPLKTALMNSLFKLYELTYKRFNKMYDFQLEHDHPSGQKEIIPALERWFRIEEQRYFINSVFKLYTVLKCRKS